MEQWRLTDRELKEHYPDLLIVMMTAHGSTATAVEAMKAEAHDYLGFGQKYFCRLFLRLYSRNSDCSFQNGVSYAYVFIDADRLRG